MPADDASNIYAAHDLDPGEGQHDNQQTGQCDCSFAAGPPLDPGEGQHDNQQTGQCDCSLAGSEPELTAWLHITDRCNLRCAYCYLPHQPANMAPATGYAAVDATVRSALTHGYRRIKLKYAGGEPLLRFATMADIHRYAQAAAHWHNLALEGVLLTNGTLLSEEHIEELCILGLRLVVSLDGLHAAHDCQRCYPDGRGSAHDVTRAIDLALEYGLLPAVSITVSGRNVADLPALMAWLLERDLPFGINFYREHVLSRHHSDLRLEEEQIIAGMQETFRTIARNLPRRSLLSSLLDHASFAAPHAHTCAVGRSYLVFDPQGRVARCQMQMQQTITRASTVDPLALVRADTQGIHNLPVDAKEGCRDCEWKYWCAGGCPLVTYRATGRYDVQSPNCNIYKTLYPELLRLEKLRRQKYGAAGGGTHPHVPQV